MNLSSQSQLVYDEEYWFWRNSKQESHIVAKNKAIDAVRKAKRIYLAESYEDLDSAALNVVEMTADVDWIVTLMERQAIAYNLIEVATNSSDDRYLKYVAILLVHSGFIEYVTDVELVKEFMAIASQFDKVNNEFLYKKDISLFLGIPIRELTESCPKFDRYREKFIHECKKVGVTPSRLKDNIVHRFIDPKTFSLGACKD